MTNCRQFEMLTMVIYAVRAMSSGRLFIAMPAAKPPYEYHFAQKIRGEMAFCTFFVEISAEEFSFCILRNHIIWSIMNKTIYMCI